MKKNIVKLGLIIIATSFILCKDVSQKSDEVYDEEYLMLLAAHNYFNCAICDNREFAKFKQYESQFYLSQIFDLDNSKVINEDYMISIFPESQYKDMDEKLNLIKNNIMNDSLIIRNAIDSLKLENNISLLINNYR